MLLSDTIDRHESGMGIAMNPRGPLEVVIGDVVQLKKPHPCGCCEWTVTRLGADIGLRCNGCDRRVMLSRRTLEKRLKGFVQRGPAWVLAEEILAGSSSGSDDTEHAT